jgi:hypothetical protein
MSLQPPARYSSRLQERAEAAAKVDSGLQAGLRRKCQTTRKSLAASDVTPERIAMATASLPLPPVASQ